YGKPPSRTNRASTAFLPARLDECLSGDVRDPSRPGSWLGSRTTPGTQRRTNPTPDFKSCAVNALRQTAVAHQPLIGRTHAVALFFRLEPHSLCATSVELRVSVVNPDLQSRGAPGADRTSDPAPS